MPALLAANAAEVLEIPFWIAVGIVGVGSLITLAGVAGMLLESQAPRTRGPAAAEKKGPWDVVLAIVKQFLRWGRAAWALFMDRSRSRGERVIGVGLLLVFIGVLLTIVLGVLWAIASGVAGDDGGDADVVPTVPP